MKNKTIITISRQFGSGGRIIGKMIADQLGIPFYDKALIEMAAKDSGVDAELFENADETHSNSFWDTLASSANIYGNIISVYNDIPINDKLFILQSKVIKKLADQGSCVIVGRCANYILRDNPSAIHVFIHARTEDRLNRIINEYGVIASEAKTVLAKTDKRRSAYYNYHSDVKWGLAENYDFSISTSAISIEDSIEIIKTFSNMKLSK